MIWQSCIHMVVQDYALHKIHMHCLDKSYVWLYKIMHCQILACKTSEHIEIPRKIMQTIARNFH